MVSTGQAGYLYGYPASKGGGGARPLAVVFETPAENDAYEAACNHLDDAEIQRLLNTSKSQTFAVPSGHTKAKVMKFQYASSPVKHECVRVKVLSGDYAGREGWTYSLGVRSEAAGTTY